MLQKEYEAIKEIFLLLDDGDNRLLEKHNLTQAQFYALLWLEDSPKTMSQLSQAMLCDPSNITRVSAILERKGYISRQRSEKDRRVVDLTLTPEGESLCREVHEAHESYTQHRMNILTPTEQAELLALLGKLGDGLRRELHPETANLSM